MHYITCVLHQAHRIVCLTAFKRAIVMMFASGCSRDEGTRLTAAFSHGKAHSILNKQPTYAGANLTHSYRFT